MSVLVVDPHSAVPPFDQLRRQLIEQIMGRQLSPGDKLPAVRRLAADLGLAPNTVARTYRELEAEGFVVTRGRNGTVVADVAPTGDAQAQAAETLTSGFVANMRALGLGRDAILARVRTELERVSAAPGAAEVRGG